jgi:hypothetical protein
MDVFLPGSGSNPNLLRTHGNSVESLFSPTPLPTSNNCKITERSYNIYKYKTRTYTEGGVDSHKSSLAVCGFACRDERPRTFVVRVFWGEFFFFLDSKPGVEESSITVIVVIITEFSVVVDMHLTQVAR